MTKKGDPEWTFQVPLDAFNDTIQKAKHAKEKAAYEKKLAKQPWQTPTIADLIANAMSEFEDLASEINDSASNLEEYFPDKASRYQDCASTLENLSAPDIPETLGKIELRYQEMPSKRSGKEWRRNCATSDLQRVVDYLEDCQTITSTKVSPTN